MLVRLANREDHDQTASSEAESDREVCAVHLGCFSKQLLLEILEHLR